LEKNFKSFSPSFIIKLDSPNWEIQPGVTGTPRLAGKMGTAASGSDAFLARWQTTGPVQEQQPGPGEGSKLPHTS